MKISIQRNKLRFVLYIKLTSTWFKVIIFICCVSVIVRFQYLTRWLYCVECPQYSTRRRSASYRAATIIGHGLILGSNIWNSAEYLNPDISDILNDSLCCRLVNHICVSRRTTQSCCRAANLLELVMFKRGLLHVDGFAYEDYFSAATSNLCKSWC